MRRLFFLLLAGWIIGSFVCTGLNVNVWPFPSLNVFSELPKEKSGQWLIRIRSINEKYELDPGNVLPIEFFVARAFIGDVVKSKDVLKIEALLDYINANLGQSRFGFDERWEKRKLNVSGPTQIQIVLRVSKTETSDRYKTQPVADYVLGEKSYVR